MADQLQTQRLELKYIVPETVIERVRDFVRPHLVLDSFGQSQPDLSYPVHSLYLDSRDYALHQSTINGDRNRYKLRIRFYENRPGSPIFLEIKRREDNAIYKERCAVAREGIEDVAAGRLPMREHLVNPTPDNERALLNFTKLVNSLHAGPVAHVSYRREAWSTPDSNRCRVTFDRNVTTSPENAYRFDPGHRDPVSVFGSAVVLELKFTGRFPGWMVDMVRIFGLRQCSAAKYVDGLVRMEELRILEPILSDSSFAALERRVARQFIRAPFLMQNRPAPAAP
ncbi:MAG: polyphosphate polymerase domain-containing protein [Opitutales bacterium]|nr:polyphosphate polymerase domain-containing protein [Opitutales bacterium]